MTEDIKNENVPEENTPKNPTESNSVSGEQTEQATDANPTAAPVLEQAVEGGTANQEIPQQAPVPPTESVAPQGQQTAFEQQVASPFTNPVSPTAPTVTARKELHCSSDYFFRCFSYYTYFSLVCPTANYLCNYCLSWAYLCNCGLNC